MDTPETPDSLSRTLAAWRIAPRRDPQFRSAVWARVGRAAAAPFGTYVRRHATAFAGALAVAIVAGALSGHGQARARVAAESAQLATAYVRGLDARTMALR